MRDIEKFTDVPQEVGDVPKEKWQQELHNIGPRWNDPSARASKEVEEVAKVEEFTIQKKSSARRTSPNGLKAVSGSRMKKHFKKNTYKNTT